MNKLRKKAGAMIIAIVVCKVNFKATISRSVRRRGRALKAQKRE
jgi:hypothetical protein